jgi:hypothetical protein
MSDDQPSPSKKTRTRKPLSADELVARGLRRSEKGRKAAAREDFTLATQLDPANEGAWLGLLSLSKTEIDLRTYAETITAINPANEQAIEILATLDRLKAEREEEARQVAEWRASFLGQMKPLSRYQSLPPLPAPRHQNNQGAWLVFGGLAVLVLLFIIWANMTRPPRPSYTAPVRVYATVAPAPAPRSPASSPRRIGAICSDGTRSGATGRGACSHHGGVAQWLYSE